MNWWRYKSRILDNDASGGAEALVGEIPSGEREVSGGAELLTLALLNSLTHF